MKEIPLFPSESSICFKLYEKKFKALADEQRLQILHELVVRKKICVCNLSDVVEMKQSKLSYHLKILLDAGFITKETEGTWSYYQLNEEELNEILSEKLSCVFTTKTRNSCE